MTTPKSNYRLEQQSIDYLSVDEAPRRSKCYSMPFWFHLLPLDRQEELHQTLLAIVAKHPIGSSIERSVAEVQRRFQLEELQVLELINRYRYELLPSFRKEDETIEHATHDVAPPLNIVHAALPERQKMSISGMRIPSVHSFAMSTSPISMRQTSVETPLSDGTAFPRHSLDSIDTFNRPTRKTIDSDSAAKGEFEGIEGPESCRKVEQLRRHFTDMMMAAKQRDDFAAANVYQQHVIKLQLRLSETKNRKDRLTKLLNRNAFEEDLPIFELMCQDVSDDEGQKAKSAIIAIDLINFKLLNDKLGHKQGDRALRRFAHALRKVAKEIAGTTGYVWNVYRVGGDEFVITGFTCCRDIFEKVCNMCGLIRIPWAGLLSDCNYDACTFGRVGGVYGKHIRYVDADILERWLKCQSKNDRYTLAQPDEIQTVLMYYVDKCDRDKVIKEQESAIVDAMERREFKRCSELQQYIDFLQEGFSKLQYEKNLEFHENEEDLTLTNNSAYFDCYPINQSTRRPSLRDVFPDSTVNNNSNLFNEAIVTVPVNHVLPKEKNKERLVQSVSSSTDANSKIEPEIFSKTPENLGLKVEQTSPSNGRYASSAIQKFNECKINSDHSHLRVCVPPAAEGDSDVPKLGVCSSSRLSCSYNSPSVKHSHYHSCGSSQSDRKSTSDSSSHSIDNALSVNQNLQINTTCTGTQKDMNIECISKKENVDTVKFDTSNSNYFLEEGCKSGIKYEEVRERDLTIS